jgi:hypothetical protein
MIHRWLIVFSLQRLFYALAIFCMLQYPSCAATLNEVQLQKCKSIQRNEILRAATASIIDLGSEAKRDGVPDNKNPWPYLSFDDMIQKHPNCCSISTKFLGDYDSRIRNHFEGSSFKAYFVRIQLPSVAQIGKDFVSTRYDRTAIVTCFGQAVAEEQLIKMGD